MSFAVDLTTMLSDFGVTVTDGLTQAKGILDMPTDVLAGEQVLSTDYMLTIRADAFPNLTYGSALTVNGAAYQVRRVTNLDDGLICAVTLQKV